MPGLLFFRPSKYPSGPTSAAHTALGTPDTRTRPICRLMPLGAGGFARQTHPLPNQKPLPVKPEEGDDGIVISIFIYSLT